jgi:SM-20-related protein
MDPIVIDEALPGALYGALLEWARKIPLEYGAKSNSKNDPHGHFSHKPVHDERLNLADLTARLPMPINAAWQGVMEHFSKVIGVGRPADATTMPPWKLIRCYVNGYVYGTDGYFHRDSDRPDELTAILYLCRAWPLDWAGETAVSGRLYWSIMPAPNRLLVISSNDLHAARAVSRRCPELRAVLVLKFRPQRTQMFETLSEWLVTQGALDLKHGKDSSLHDHLVRTYWLLHDRVSADVAMGGGIHSIYGTNAFTTALIPVSDYRRGQVAAFAGKDAEDLAYKFSILDRPRTLDYIAELINQAVVAPASGRTPVLAGYGAPNTYGYALLELRCKERLKVSFDLARNLCMIEAANLLDQGVLDRWRNLANLWAAGASASPTIRSKTPSTSATSGS